MDVTREKNGQIILTFELEEGRALAKEVENVRDMPGALLNLGNLLQSAYYEARDEFRQPPDPWAPGTKHPDSL